MSSSKSKSTTKYNAQALPFINSATSAVQGAYQNNLGNVSDVTSALKSSFDNYNVTNPNLTAAGSYVSDVLGGKYLNGNPYLQGIIDDTNSSVTDQVNALFSKAGQTGSSRQIGELGKQLASAENNLRYANYSDEQDRIANAISQATGLNSATNQNLATQLALGSGLTSIGTDAANSYANALASLWGNNTTTTNKSSPSLGSSIGSALSTAGSLASLFSDSRLKTDIRKVGEEADGLGVYEYRYIWGGPVQRGVMADEVASLRPWALGPERAGFATVNYEKL